MAAQQQTPQSARVPPDVPADKEISPKLTEYLRNFSLWCRFGFAEQMRNNEAQANILMRAWDTAAGETPKVFRLRVSKAGVVDAVPIDIAGNLTQRSVPP
jgi:hypothetical protein